VLEIGAALDRPHLKDRVLVFRAPEVKLPSNFNPVYQPLDLENVAASFPAFEEQARAWQVLGLEASDAAPVEPSSPDTDLPKGRDSSPASVAQAAAALSELAALFVGGEADTEEDETIIARAHLAASTALALVRSSEPLGVHELNGLYRDRVSVVPSETERTYLLRAVVANIGAANAPGWYWLRDESAEGIRTRISALALNESDSNAAREAIKLLINSEAGPSRSHLRAIVRQTLRHEGGVNADSGLALLRRHGTRTDLRALSVELGTHSKREPVAAARIAVQSRESPAAALRALIESPTNLDATIENNLLEGAKALPQTKVREALHSPAPALRQLGLKLLDATSKLRKANAIEAIEDDREGAVRVLGAALAIKRGWRLEQEQFEKATKDSPWTFDQHELGVKFTALRSAEELSKDLSWYGVNPYWTYEALGRKRFPSIEERIAGDLETDFADLRDADRLGYAKIVQAEVEKELDGTPTEEHRERITKMVEAAVKKYVERWAKLDEFLLRQFRIAALATLVQHSAPEYARFGPTYLADENRETATLAIRLVRLCGGPEDVSALSSLASQSWGTLRGEAAAAALELAEDSRATALSLLAIDDAEVVGLALRALRGSELDKAQVEALWPLLRNEQLSIRNAVTEHLIAELSRGQLRTLLDSYSRGQYYYSVIAAIDRALYAPGWVRQSARRILGG
jgi:hypothetical protein